MIVRLGTTTNDRKNITYFNQKGGGGGGGDEYSSRNCGKGKKQHEIYAVPKINVPSGSQRMEQHDQSKSFDDDYDQYRYNSNMDFDKSRSFDDEYYNNDNENINETRAFSNNMYNNPNPKYEHQYDVIQQKQQPRARSRECSPNHRTHRQMHKNKVESPHRSEYIVKHNNKCSTSPGQYFDVEYEIERDIMNEDLLKEAELVTEFLYGKKHKAESYLNQSRERDTRKIVSATATPSSGRYFREPN